MSGTFMAKNDPLNDYLDGFRNDEITLSFEQIEKIIQDKLPVSAFKYRAWWSPRPGPSSPVASVQDDARFLHGKMRTGR